MNTVGTGKWQEKLKNLKNEKCTPQDLDYVEKTETWKNRRTHCMTWNMA